MLAAFTAYVRLVSNTSTWAAASADHFASVRANQPFILALWHGQTMLVPEVVRKEIKPLRAIVANTFVAAPLARALQHMGIGVIRGAGPDWRGQDRGGARALRAAVRSLAEGFSAEAEELERWRQRVERRDTPSLRSGRRGYGERGDTFIAVWRLAESMAGRPRYDS